MVSRSPDSSRKAGLCVCIAREAYRLRHATPHAGILRDPKRLSAHLPDIVQARILWIEVDSKQMQADWRGSQPFC